MSEYAHNFPDVTSVGIGAFANATFSGAINLPKVQSLPDAGPCPEKPQDADHDYGVFEGSNLETINLSSLKSIGSRAFYRVPLKSDENNINNNFHNVEYVGNSAFYGARFQPQSHSGCFDFTSVTYIGVDAFRSASQYTETGRRYIITPNVRIIKEGAFYESLLRPAEINGNEYILNLPECTEIHYDAFGSFMANYTASYHKIYLRKIISLGDNCFKGLAGKAPSEDYRQIHIGKNCVSMGVVPFRSSGFNTIDIYFYGTEPPQLSDALARTWGEEVIYPHQIYVPEASVDQYKDSWKNVGDLHVDYRPYITSMTLAPNPQNW